MNKKLGLLLLPLLPLSALGIVEVASRILPSDPTVAESECTLPGHRTVSRHATPIAPPSTPGVAAPAAAPDA
jgi:hypothetical protein